MINPNFIPYNTQCDYRLTISHGSPSSTISYVSLYVQT